ncbi:peptidylprolyl isomerase [Tundrisphaera lichenicola]|uniref:peptidylprolyl isomerase n=1 Tax=Tundrisphaera lichenicola TaxID=2029860 RepID=UPI003EBEE524
MLSRSRIPIALVLASTILASGPALEDDDHPVVILDTTAGPITLELDRAKAPITVENFLKYVDSGFYDGLIFHRVIPRFMIQGGGMREVNNILVEKKEGSLPPIKNESSNGLSNTPGTIAMARAKAEDSATSQFFINHGSNPQLDRYAGGYAVFGKVTEGLDVIDTIAKSETTTKLDSEQMPFENVPLKPITIKTARRKSL